MSSEFKFPVPSPQFDPLQHYSHRRPLTLPLPCGELEQYEAARQLAEDTSPAAGSWATTTPTPWNRPPPSPLS